MSVAGRLALIRGRWLWRSFDQMTERPAEMQHRLLSRLLAANQATGFGRRHRFGRMKTTADYQAAVPIGDYERLRPWIDRVRQGETNVLTAEQPSMFSLTSGTTGQPKLIPVNRATRRSTARLSALWLYRALLDHPRVLDGKALLVVSPAVDGHTPSGIPFGSASGYIYQNASWVLRRIYAVPYPVFTIKDYESKYYAIMRFALEQTVSLLITANPSTIVRLLALVGQRSEELVRDIHDGTIAASLPIDPDVRRALQSGLRPNPRRAKELERAVAQDGSLQPGGYWPGLSLVGCWKGGSVGVTLERLRISFEPGVSFRDIGYLSSEAQVTLPVDDAGSAGILALDTAFYEFVPEEEMGSANPRVLTAEQLDQGQSYYILLTTLTGLYRYDINDVVRVTGFHRRTPLLEFVRKGRDMVSLTGEKLHVGQLLQAMNAAQQEAGVQVAHFRAVGRAEASRYDLFLELERYPASDEALVKLGRAVDKQLAALNIEYAQKRQSGRLGPPLVCLMPSGWRAWRLQAKLSRGGRDTQFKDTLLGLPDAEDDDTQLLRELRLE